MGKGKVLPEHLRSLDPFLAAFPVSIEKDLEIRWSKLTSWIKPETIIRIIPKGGRVDSMTSSTISDNLEIRVEKDDELINFKVVNLRRSWADDAIGGERSKWAQDKSWEFNRIIGSYKNGRECMA